MKLIWTITGDELPIIPANQNLAEYYVDSLNKENKNHFDTSHTLIDPTQCDMLIYSYNTVVELLEKFNLNSFPKLENPLDQQQLNNLHTEWVELSRSQTKFLTALRLMGEEQVEIFREVNERIHIIESMFDLTAVNYENDAWMIENTLGQDILSFDLSNISIIYHNLGRQQYERFRANDLSWKGRDEFTTLSGELSINLHQPETRIPSVEFLNWCKKQDEEPIGAFCPLGNFKDLNENLTKYRKIFIKNLYETDSGNRFFFEV